jgi:phosphatidate phosphatase PAH1
LSDSLEHHMKVELRSNVSEEQRDELKEKIEDMEGDILQTQFDHLHPRSEDGDIATIAGVKYLEVTPRGSPMQSARGTTNIFDKYKIQDRKVDPKFMKTMFDKEVHGSDVDTKGNPKISFNNVNINNVDPVDEEISEEKVRYVDSIINKVTTAHRASPVLPRKESAEDLQRLNEEKDGADKQTENNVNTTKSGNIDIKKDEQHEHESRSTSPEKDSKLDWSSLKFNDLQIEISNCGNIIFEPPVNEDEKKMEQIFDENLVSYEQFSTNPQMLFKSNIAFRIQNKIFPWQVAGPMLISLLAFKRPPDVNAMANVMYDAQSDSSSSKSSTAPTLSVEKKLDPSNAQKKRFSWGNFFKWGKKDENGAPIRKTFLRSLKPTSDQLSQLNLKPGANTITFSVTSRFQGMKEISASIFLWDSNVKVCISDIDGTITKSDVFGQILPQFGKDWSHGGVVKFFNSIKNNGYEMLYLTARAIGQADITKNYLQSLDHEGVTLPIGPILMSPDRLFSSLNREVIIRKPHKFKIACLTDILSLFPEGAKPFYAGFGNRATDAISYVAVGVPEAKIFTINEFSEISYACSMYTRTYIKLNELVDPMFPPINGTGSGTIAEEYNDFQYWERPQYKLEDIEAEILRK